MSVCNKNIGLLGSVERFAKGQRQYFATRSSLSLISCGWAYARTPGTCKAWNRRVHTKSQQPDNTPGSGGVFKPAESEEEWLQLDEKVNEYPTSRTFKAIGSGGQEFAELMVGAVEKATARAVDRRIQVVQRPSKEGKYLSVSIRSVSVDSGRQVLNVFREMKSSGGRQLKFII